MHQKQRSTHETESIPLTEYQGFEGFRTRSIAALVNINVATLHYYFPTKEDLIGAVASHLEELYAKSSAPPVRRSSGDSPALRMLRQELAVARFMRKNSRDLLTVSRELAMRGARDESIRRLIGRLTEHWLGQFESIIVAGKVEGMFGAGIDPRSTAGMIVSALWGADALVSMDEPEFDALCSQIEKLLLAQGNNRRKTTE